MNEKKKRNDAHRVESNSTWSGPIDHIMSGNFVILYVEAVERETQKSSKKEKVKQNKWKWLLYVSKVNISGIHDEYDEDEVKEKEIKTKYSITSVSSG